MIEIKLLYANMGKAQCGDVFCVVVIDHANKTVITKPQAYTWKQGNLIYYSDVGSFSVPYVREVVILPRGFVHEVRDFTEEEKRLIDAALASMYA